MISYLKQRISPNQKDAFIADNDGDDTTFEDTDRLKNWQPEPLVPDFDPETSFASQILHPKIVTGKPTQYTQLSGIGRCLNLATPNFLALADNPRLEQAAKDGVARYGVGSCGPRAFYGTMDVHLQLEQDIAKFLNVQEALLYSFGFTTIASAIPAYAKPKDIVFADECCNFAIQQGMIVSRATIVLFRHNDMDHLKQLVSSYGREQLLTTRSFIIVEGIYDRTGTICKLSELVKIKHEYKIRLFVDESNSLCVLGATGRGITEHCNVDVDNIDLIMSSLEKAFCSYGGFCAGSSYVVDHQRIAGSGYIFSASLPPFQVKVAIEAIKLVQENKDQFINEAQRWFEEAHEKLKKLTKFRLISDAKSPIKHLVPRKYSQEACFTLTSERLSEEKRRQLRFGSASELSLSEDYLKAMQEFKAESKELIKLCEHVLKEEKIIISAAQYILDEELTLPLPSLRIVIPGCKVELSNLIDTLNNQS